MTQDQSEHKFPYIVNVCYIFNDKNEVLLQKKARGFGQGNWNAPGGKIETNETPELSCKREIFEETGITLNSIEKRGEIEFVFLGNEEINNYCHVFCASDYSGEAIDGGEGELKWFKIDAIPYDLMWDDDRYWVPDIMAGGNVRKRFYFDSNKKVIKQINLIVSSQD